MGKLIDCTCAWCGGQEKDRYRQRASLVIWLILLIHNSVSNEIHAKQWVANGTIDAAMVCNEWVV